MLILLEVGFILLLICIYFYREVKRRIKYYRTGDVIWVREKLLKPEKAILIKWDDLTFCYIPDDSDEIRYKLWLFLARNESYKERQNALG